ncbi:hypothetical protein G6F68_014007 [Rhizopus microsporus]|nr:hypothetical protein G6F68_014007 [Rhizopus microsporus]
MAARAVSAARMIGLDICGVDVVAESVHYPLEDQHGGVVEVNAAPGLRMHLNPSFGKGRAVGEAIIANMYADGDDGRIPVVAVAGTNGKTTTVRLTAHLLGTAGNRVGMTNSDGVYVDNLRIDTGDCSGPRSARSVLMHPDAWPSTAATWPSSPTSAWATTWGWATSAPWKTWPWSSGSSCSTCIPRALPC